ncbi:uncharacterized protein CTRU02_202809 [Colletotrichum truncatum]|uniref:Uncharacterized protein n=1 Tax=Colletotrichum truncatum TaxID=5467 RepID=A0ACC3ZLB3_COLTU|nr:uncharacterized protein CTRU02_10733 [Colletotrichum truncatum]KAF6787034.1 hypothetical protein CTRU02_10733 [Colletotrichum truncatum]
MRRTDASALVIAGLAALAKARELQIDDVPVECATICGPIVELSFRCDVDNSFDELRRLKRRNIDSPRQNVPPSRRQVRAKPVLTPRRHHRKQQEDQETDATPSAAPDQAAPANGEEVQQQPQQDVQQQPAQDAAPVFITTLPFAAPSPDPQVTPSETAQTTPTPDAQQQSTPAPVAAQPDVTTPSAAVTPSAPAASSPPIPQITPPIPPPVVIVPSIAISIPQIAISLPFQQPPAQQSQAPSPPPPQGGGSGEKKPEQKLAEDRENAERDCICKNKSFDVQLLAGMCQSCIRQSRNRANDMDYIMGTCNFTESTYTPDKDSLAFDIRVAAQKPMLAFSANAMGDAGRLGNECAAVAVAVGIVTGLALLL